MVFKNRDPDAVVRDQENIRLTIQNVTGRAVIIETIRTMLVEEGSSLSFGDVGYEFITIVKSFLLLENLLQN